jgi:hypothetical protein
VAPARGIRGAGGHGRRVGTRGVGGPDPGSALVGGVGSGGAGIGRVGGSAGAGGSSGRVGGSGTGWVGVVPAGGADSGGSGSGGVELGSGSGSGGPPTVGPVRALRPGSSRTRRTTRCAASTTSNTPAHPVNHRVIVP